MPHAERGCAGALDHGNPATVRQGSEHPIRQRAVSRLAIERNGPGDGGHLRKFRVSGK
jgi:hypothetical protein